ncbi:MAG: DinB family protein [Terracidiphilus sp.]|jgi:hypothetical protein
MPIPSQIANAANSFQLNADLFKKSTDGLTAEEWLRRPNDKSNHILWIFGHVIWARGVVLKFLGSEYSQPWFPLFARGAKLDEAAVYPTPEEATAAWQEVSAQLATAMEGVSEDVLSKQGPPGIPSPDGKVSGVVNFLAHHETYHVGQTAYLRSWLGHGGIVG